jgi:Tfp pilus assembly protein PilO
MAKRGNWKRTAIRVGLLLVALDAVAYLAIDRSMAGLVAREEQQFAATRLQWRSQEAALLRVQRRVDALPTEEKQLRRFVEKHIPRRREGYSRAAVLIENLTQRSGVQFSGIGFGRVEDQDTAGPFRVLAVNVSVQGPFANLLSFSHGLDTASDFLVVRSFKFETSGQGVLGLRLTAELYLMP